MTKEKPQQQPQTKSEHYVGYEMGKHSCQTKIWYVSLRYSEAAGFKGAMKDCVVFQSTAFSVLN